ncbi:MAG: diguanylate cyclase [Patescibacteria group bacterium]
MDLRESLRIKETPKIVLGTAQYQERIQQAEQALHAAEDSGDEEAVESRRNGLKIVNSERELFYLQHDTTGALKGERFGRDIRQLAETYGLERGPDGAASFKNEAEAARTHFLQINMGELDRLNASGDHSLGDRGLELTFQHVQAKLREALVKAHPESAKDETALAAMYDVYRTAGNDFSVTLKNVDRSFAESLKDVLSKPLDISAERPDQDPIPLSASRSSLEDATKLLNMLEQSPQEAGLEDETVLISLLKEKLQTVNDFEKIRTRGQRMADKIHGGAETGKMDARRLYDEFLKKYVGNLFAENGETAPPTFEDFSKKITDLGAFEEHPITWKGKLFEVARDEAIKMFKSRNATEQANGQKILENVLADLERQASEESLPKSDRPKIGIEKRQTQEFGEAQQRAIEAFRERSAALGQTEGHAAIESLKQQMDTSVAETGTHADEHRRLARLAYDVERSKRDYATGLYGRGEYFQTLEKNLKEGAPVTAIAVDMAFLKFFDKEGGGKTGDEAIITAGRVMDYVKRQLKEKHGISAEAYRVGGDEFSLTLGTVDPKIVQEALADISLASDEIAGPIPAFEGASANYRPETLQFNFGRHSASSGEALRAQLKDWGVELTSEAGSAEELHELSDKLNEIADQGVEWEKGVNRLAFLLSRSLEAERADDGEKGEREQELAVLRSYSEKAIFGNHGRSKLAEWKQKLMDRKMDIGGLVQAEIVPFVEEQLREKGKAILKYEDGLVSKLENNLRLSFAELRISELEKDLVSKEASLGAEHEKVVALGKELATMRKEHDEIASLRSRIAGA